MPQLKRLARWSMILGVAIAVQACGDAAPKGLKLVGAGGCRNADGSEGRPTTVKVASLEECTSQCREAGKSCTAIEYNANNGSCELHSEPISKFEQAAGVSCYAVE